MEKRQRRKILIVMETVLSILTVREYVVVVLLKTNAEYVVDLVLFMSVDVKNYHQMI